MKRMLLTAAATLLLAGCQTYPPTYDPYPPPAPYPPATPYPPAPPYPPQDAYPPAPTCPIASSRDWRAWVDAMPGPQGPKLLVSGTVVTPTLGYQLSFEPVQIREREATAFVTLRAVPPSGMAGQAVDTRQVRWEWPVYGPTGRVVVRCGEQTLADISPVERAL